jgi:hypothetical protein
MKTDLELIEQLKNARTVPQMARATALLLRACGVFNFQAVGHELSRISVTSDCDGFAKQLKDKRK